VDPVYQLLREPLRKLGEHQAVRRNAELWFSTPERQKDLGSSWQPGDPVDTAEGMAEISAVQGLAALNDPAALSRARRLIQGVLTAEYDRVSRKVWLLWRIWYAISDAGRWGSAPSEAEESEWTELHESLGRICADVALGYSRSAQRDPSYLDNLSSMATLLRDTAIGGVKGMLAAAEIFQTLAERLAEVRGEYANPTLTAWEDAAEALDRAGQDGLSAKSDAIRSMLAERYGQAFAAEAKESGLASQQAQFYLSKQVDYLGLTGQLEAIVQLGRRLYRQAAEQYGDGSGTAMKLLEILSNRVTPAEIIGPGPAPG
jgi:hypothetical protein